MDILLGAGLLSVHLQKQRPTYYRDTTNLCTIHVYYIIVTIIMHYNSIYHVIYSIIIMIAIASLIVFAEVTGERVTGKQELRIWAGLETTLIYCVHLSMNCIHAMHSIMSLAPDPAVEMVTAAFLRRD